MQTTILGMKKVIKQYERTKRDTKIKKNTNKKKEKEFVKEIVKKIKQAEQELARGEGRDADEVFKEWETKYGY